METMKEYSIHLTGLLNVFVLGLVLLGHGMASGLALTNGFSALFGFGAVAIIGFIWAMGFAKEDHPLATLGNAAIAGLLPTALLVATLVGIGETVNAFIGPILTSMAIYLLGSLVGVATGLYVRGVRLSDIREL